MATVPTNCRQLVYEFADNCVKAQSRRFQRLLGEEAGASHGPDPANGVTFARVFFEFTHWARGGRPGTLETCPTERLYVEHVSNVLIPTAGAEW